MGRTDTYQPSHAARIEGLRANDPQVLREIYTAHFPSVCRFVLKNNGLRDDAMDMFQEAVSVLWLKAKDNQLEEGTDPGAFLFRVARNKWLDHLRSASRRNMSVVPVEHIPDQEAEATADAEERIQRMRSVYERMDERCRTVLGRFYFERNDLATIAAAMGVSEESIRTIKYRCMMKLRAFRRTIEGVQAEREDE